MKKVLLIVAVIVNCQLSMVNCVYAQTFRWAKSLGGSGNDGANGIAADHSGHIYSIGYFAGTADFNPGAPVSNLTSAGGQDIYISKLDTAGNFVWAKAMGGTSNDAGYSIVTDISGDILSTGNYGGTADFDPGGLSFPLTSSGAQSVFISKLDASGNFVWAQNLTGSGQAYGRGIATDHSGNIYVTGFFYGTIDFDPGFSVFNLSTPSVSADAFICKLNPSGNFLWAVALGGTDEDDAYAITVDDSSYVYTTGSFRSTADFDPGTGVFNLTSINNENIFISKLDSLGNFVWARSTEGPGSGSGYGIAVDMHKNVLTTGYYNGTSDFNPSATDSFNLTTAGINDVFISKLDRDGNFLWAKSLGGNGNDYGYSVQTDDSSDVYVTGYFVNMVDFDPDTSVVVNLFSSGGNNPFVMKLYDDGNFAWARSMGGPNGGDAASLALDDSANVYTTGWYLGTADFDTGPGILNLVSVGITDSYIHKLKQCSVPFTPSSIIGSSPVCAGTTNTYSIGSVSGATSYTWWNLSGWTGSSSTNIISLGSNSNDGIINVRSTNSCGNSKPRSVTITSVNSVPAVPGSISGNTTICSGTNNTYSIAQVSGASSYTWTLPSGWSGSSITDSISTLAGTTSGKIYVGASNVCGASALDSLSITVNLPPAVPSNITGNTTICSGSPNIYNVSSAVDANSYTWSLPSGWTGNSTTHSITATCNSTSGTVSVVAHNACGSSPQQDLAVTVNSIPAIPGIISGNTTICSGSSNTYSISSVSGATSYFWTLPVGWTGTLMSNSVGSVASESSGNISVTAHNNCGTSAAQLLPVVVDTTPVVPTAIFGNVTLCSGSSNIYSIAPVSGTTSYSWTLPTGWTGASTTTTITAVSNAASGNILVTANNGSCASAPQTLAVNVTQSLPAGISIFAAPSGAICPGTSVTFTAAPVNSGTAPVYQWTLNGTNAGTSTGTYTNSSLANGDTINCRITSNAACLIPPATVSSNTITMTVNPIPPVPTITEPITGTLHSSAASGNQWFRNSLIIATANAQDYLYTQNGTYSVQVTIAGCKSNSLNYPITNVGIESRIANCGLRISVYPNPVYDELFIECSEQIISAELVDLIGNRISITSDNQLSTENLSSGIYFLKLTTRYRTQIIKIIKV